MAGSEDLTDYRSLALSGIVLAAELVHASAHGQPQDQAAAAAVRRAIRTHRAATLAEIFGPPGDYRAGVRATLTALQGKSDNPQVLRYALQIIELANLLRQTPQVVERLGSELDGLPDAPTDADLAGVYQATISTLGKRIQVTGNPALLQQQETAERIRACLLGGIRFAWLWHQLGGRRWHLLVRRKQIQRALEDLHTILQSTIH